MTFSPNQIERRTLYFEGDPAELVQTQNRFNMLQTVKAERTNLTSAPICSKGDNKNCYNSVNRVKAVIMKDFIQEREIESQISPIDDKRVLSSLHSEDLYADGVIDETLS